MADTDPKFDPDESFDEAWYVRNYADIADAVTQGHHASGQTHYLEHGRSEGRHPYDPRIVALLEEANEQAPGTLYSWDDFLVAEQGGLITGWLDDRSDGVAELVLQPYFGPPVDLLPRLLRHRRDDIAEMLGVPSNAFEYGVAIPLEPVAPGLPPLGAQIAIRFASGRAVSRHLPSRRIGPEELRDRVLEAAALTAGRTPPNDALGQIAGRIAGQVARALDRSVQDGMAAAAPVRFGKSAAPPALSVIIAGLGAGSGSGAPQRQAAFFAATAGIERAEFIFVDIGRGHAGGFAAQIEAAAVLYGLDATALAATASSRGRARNAGAAAARAERLLFLSPACIPAGTDWLDRALATADVLGARGVAGGGVLDEDDAIIACGLRMARDARFGMVRAEALLAGLPRRFLPEGLQQPDAVTADAMLVPAAFFRELGGFSTDFVLAGGEELDFCQRVLDADAQVLADPRLVFRRLAVRAAPAGKPEEGAAWLNHARFNELWSAVIEAG